MMCHLCHCPFCFSWKRNKKTLPFGSEKCVLLPHLSCFYAGFGTLQRFRAQVAGFHRAVPSTALDKVDYSLTEYILYKISVFVKGKFRHLRKI